MQPLMNSDIMTSSNICFCRSTLVSCLRFCSNNKVNFPQKIFYVVLNFNFLRFRVIPLSRISNPRNSSDMQLLVSPWALSAIRFLSQSGKYDGWGIITKLVLAVMKSFLEKIQQFWNELLPHASFSTKFHTMSEPICRHNQQLF